MSPREYRLSERQVRRPHAAKRNGKSPDGSGVVRETPLAFCEPAKWSKAWPLALRPGIIPAHRLVEAPSLVSLGNIRQMWASFPDLNQFAQRESKASSRLRRTDCRPRGVRFAGCSFSRIGSNPKTDGVMRPIFPWGDRSFENALPDPANVRKNEKVFPRSDRRCRRPPGPSRNALTRSP